MAGTIVDNVKKGGKALSCIDWTKKRMDAFKAERKKREDEKFKGNWGAKLGKNANKIQDYAHGMGSYKDASGKVHAIIPGGAKARARYDKMIVDENRDDIDKDAKKLNDSGATIAELNAKLRGAPPQSQKDFKDHAANAKAYIAKSADDRKMHIQNNIGAYNGLVNANPAHYFALMTPAQQGEYNTARLTAQAAHTAIAGGGLAPAALEGHIKTLASFANRAAEEALKHGVNAGKRK